jgi:hypothetical protein
MIVDCAHCQDGHRTDEGKAPLAGELRRRAAGHHAHRALRRRRGRGRLRVDHIKGFPAFLVYGIGGLAVPLTLLITWMRLRMPHVDTRAAVGEAAGAGHH